MPAKLLVGKWIRAEKQSKEGNNSAPSARASWKTLSHKKTKHMSYRGKMTTMSALVAGITAIILVVVLAFTWEAEFSSYTRSNNERYAGVINDSLSEVQDAPAEWNLDAVEKVVQASSLSSDAAFRVSSYGAVVTAGIVAVALACLTGILVSRKLAKPIKSITSTAAQIRSGDLTARTGITGDDEIGQLGETFDDMATSLERDLKLEHRLTSDVAHELRTPLMAMLATVEAMQDGVLPADEERLATVAGEVKRLSRLVAAVLELSRIENGTTPFKPEKTEIVGLLRSIVTSQEQLFTDSSLTLAFEVKLARKELVCEIDPDMMRQAVINLLSNAMRYTPEGGRVKLCVAQEGRDVIISVSDTGIGIAKEDLARVFSRFWRSDASRERESGGLGVGLALTKEIIDRHHGYIAVESELGAGTKFTLHVPRLQNKPQLSLQLPNDAR